MKLLLANINTIDGKVIADIQFQHEGFVMINTIDVSHINTKDTKRFIREVAMLGKKRTIDLSTMDYTMLVDKFGLKIIINDTKITFRQCDEIIQQFAEMLHDVINYFQS